VVLEKDGEDQLDNHVRNEGLVISYAETAF
jgi:hypothetical protein